VLGYRDGPDGDKALARALELAEGLVRRGPKRCAEVPLPAGLRRHAALLEARGYARAFVQYKMGRPAEPPPDAPPALDAELRWVDLEEEHVDAYRALTGAAFAGIAGSHAPPPDALRAVLLEAAIRPRLLLHEGRVAGVARLRLDGGGETGVIQLLARDPALRGRRLGDALLIEAMRALSARGARRYALEVNDANSAAIALYRRHGFEIEDEEPNYRIELG
jgi:mycothiol synthase